MLDAATTTVFILAAGRGQRMMPLTQETPKPLLKVGELSLIEHHIKRLAAMQFKYFVINVAYLGNKLMDVLGDGSRWGIKIQYSDEQVCGGLETAGGIQYALEHIKSNYFLCLNADIWTDYCFTDLLTNANLSEINSQESLATVVLVENPEHNQTGDFGIDKNNYVLRKIDLTQSQQSYTFSGIALYKKAAFQHLKPGKKALAPLLNQWSENKKLSGVIYTGQWQDIGTPERLAKINKNE